MRRRQRSYTDKGINVLKRGSPGQFMAEMQGFLDLIIRTSLTEAAKKDPAAFPRQLRRPPPSQEARASVVSAEIRHP